MPSLSLKDQTSTDCHGSDVEKSEGTLLRGCLMKIYHINSGNKCVSDFTFYVKMLYAPGLPQGVESQDSEQFFRKVLGVSDGSSLGGMRPILEGSKGELNRSALPQRPLISGMLTRGYLHVIKF